MPDLFLQLVDSVEGSGNPMPVLSDAEALELLTTGEFVASKLIPWGSNYSFAVAIADEFGREQLAIYKPRNGENPLYDFPDGTLYLREVAAWQLSEMLGWSMVPPTVAREGPMGVGSLQLYKSPREQDDESDPREFWSKKTIAIERMVLFDHIANNADRKLSHCLVDASGSVWGIDHGLCFNVEPKLRTVLWQYVGGPVCDELINDLIALRSRECELRTAFEPLLNESEVITMIQRIDEFIAEPFYPVLNPYRNIPYGWW